MSQLQLNDLPKRKGRPVTGKALTPAQKQKAYRDRQKLNRSKSGNTEQVRFFLSPLHKRVLDDLLNQGLDFNDIVSYAFFESIR